MRLAGGIEDHAHLAVTIPPKVAPAKFIGDVKGNSSHYVNHVIKPDFEFYWQDEYGVLSFGEKKWMIGFHVFYKAKKVLTQFRENAKDANV